MRGGVHADTICDRAEKTKRERCKCREEDEECDELNRIAEWRAIERERGLDKI